jgi:hypothetical protein
MLLRNGESSRIRDSVRGMSWSTELGKRVCEDRMKVSRYE